ncbi:hypothetical protein BN1211_2761 [Cyberlindnera jadinii]|uniref:Respiratory supercomplex factor 1, mitochondrial n=1 Tax=Cyberlindnera jadinii (strain ATCC 18201 / CBS 1600 / BCRC 20928 / JCM 3617 / NBRC 0987 / NRRL Y-1542) TaxID=983966 RepID=A0A0H5C3E9_CYBJN|nr:hypothetical protein CYBJADRAFT_166003 [Cyberlindnera jadinii NRRL Y-1542]ODV75246.1 hypothetical protein CYBJADRAFT_166003 [Cyberlindnera jadinii NRRL Y-1542]CEP22403.1 hypothetical protein BN1211_2761 [Cyberlindnera jadinii]
MSRVPSSFDDQNEYRQLDFIQKCVKNCKEQPLVPLGTLATTVAVILAAKSLRIGNRPGAQKWFRYRVAFQGFTIAALVVGGLVYGRGTEQARKTREEELREKAKLREKLWIEELERRDSEAKQRKERAAIARQKYLEAQEAEKSSEEK